MKDRVGNILKDVQGTDDEGEKQPDFVYLNESEKIVGAKVSTNGRNLPIEVQFLLLDDSYIS